MTKKKKEKKGEKIEINPVDSKQVRQDAISTILQKGVDFTITSQKKNLLNKLHLKPLERKFVIYPINMGTMLKISEILLDLNADELTDAMNNKEKKVNIMDLGARNIIENKDKLVKMIAYGITNNEKEPPKSLIKFLNDNLTAKEGLRLMTLVIQQMDVSPFLASLASIKGMNLLQKKGVVPGA